MIIAEIKAKTGVIVRIHDDCIAAPGSEEEKRRIQEQRRAAYGILSYYAQNEYEREKKNGTDCY